MARLSAYFLILLYSAAMLRPLAPFMEYAVNYDYIAKVLCINQDKPEKRCNGACHLKKRIQETNQPAEEGVPSLIQIADYPIGFPGKLPVVPDLDRNKNALFSFWAAPVSHLSVCDIFHPPQTHT